MSRFLVLFMSFIFFSCFTFASEQKISPQSRHIYIGIETVKITKKGLFITVADKDFPISTLFSDEKGIFITESQLQEIQGYVEKGFHRCYCRQCHRVFICDHFSKFCCKEHERLYENRSWIDRNWPD